MRPCPKSAGGISSTSPPPRGRSPPSRRATRVDHEHLVDAFARERGQQLGQIARPVLDGHDGGDRASSREAPLDLPQRADAARSAAHRRAELRCPRRRISALRSSPQRSSQYTRSCAAAIAALARAASSAFSRSSAATRSRSASISPVDARDASRVAGAVRVRSRRSSAWAPAANAHTTPHRARRARTGRRSTHVNHGAPGPECLHPHDRLRPPSLEQRPRRRLPRTRSSMFSRPPAWGPHASMERCSARGKNICVERNILKRPSLRTQTRVAGRPRAAEGRSER